MRWRKNRQSSNIEDRRGSRVRRGRGVKLGGGMGIIAVIVVLLLGGDPSQILSMLMSGNSDLGSGSVQTEVAPGPDDENKQFVSAVLADTEDTWTRIFKQGGARYQLPTMVLYSGSTPTGGCGYGSAAAGPFYCPADRKVYLDMSFFEQLKRMGAPGDFARAYVIGHEIAHHVQNLLGTMDKVNQARARSSQAQANALSVRLELQADCYAGVWAHHAHQARNILEEGDIEEGIGAAAAVGDDRIQKMSGRAVHPESFTHGSSKQRVEWFLAGLKSGALDTCDTFSS